MLLFIFFILYFLLVFVFRSLLLWKWTGINPLKVNNADNARGFNGKLFAVLCILELLFLGVYAFKPDWHKFLLSFNFLQNDILFKIGWGLLISSLIIVCVAQTQMANSWRIGIDKTNKSKLRTRGLFSVSRNPIFMGLVIANIGLFLIYPSMYTLIILILFTIIINAQINVEENFLKEEFSTEYEAYQKKVGRWI